MQWLTYIIAPILGGIIAMSGLIAKKAPNSQELLNKILPYKAFIGVGLLAVGVINLFRFGFDLPDYFKLSGLLGLTLLLILVSELLLGFMLGMPQIAKWIPGDSAPEVKAAELSKKLVKFEVPIGAIGIAAGVLALLWELKILKVTIGG